MKNHTVRGLSLLLGGCALVLLTACGDVGRGVPPTVSSNGTGEISAQPDLAILTGESIAEADTPEAAMTAVQQQLDVMIQKLRAAGVDNKDLQAAQVVVRPQWHYPRNEPRTLSGYEARAGFQLRLRDLNKLSALYGLLAEAGITQLNPTTFDFSNREALELEAIAKAVDNARRKAKVALQTLEEEPGKLQRLDINTRWQGPMVMRAEAKMVLAQADASSEPEVNVGEQTVSATVQVEFQVR